MAKIGRNKRLYNGKNKKEVAAEAFQVLGSNASLAKVNGYFRKHYKLPRCEKSMYWAAKSKAKANESLEADELVAIDEPGPTTQAAPSQSPFDLLLQVKALAAAAGGYDALERLIGLIKALKE